MKKFTLFFIISLLIFNCSDNETNVDDEFVLLGSIYRRTSFIIEIPIDVNLDGVSSNDVLEESITCISAANPLQFGLFRNDNQVRNPTFNSIRLSVNQEGGFGGELMQRDPCFNSSVITGVDSILTYELTDNIINFYSRFTNELLFIGVLSEDRNTITIDIPNELILGINPDSNIFTVNEILREDGTVEEYTGGATLIYTRIQ